MLSLPLTSADVISRRFVNIDRQYICPKSLVCRTNVNLNFDMGGDRGGGGGKGPQTCP